jgi:hypothetical protein
MIVDLEKSSGTAHDLAIHNGTKFYDERHVHKNMAPSLAQGNEEGHKP